MKRLLLTRLLAIFFGLLVFCVGAELVCRLFFAHMIAYDVEMWRYAKQLKVTGLTNGLRFEHRPGTRAVLMGVDVSINGDGLREREIPREKQDKTYRIAVVGDSITFGWGVAQDRTYPRQMERILNDKRPLGADINFEVINFGVGNYGIDDVVAMLRAKTIAYAPDLIIYGAFLNDAEGQDEIANGPSLLSYSLAAAWVWGRYDAFNRQLGVRGDYREYYLNLYSVERGGFSRVAAGIADMAEICRQQNISLVVAILPELHVDSTQTFASIYKYFNDAAVKFGATPIYLQDVLPKEDLRRYWVGSDDAHPNAQACALYAERLVTGIDWWKMLKQRVEISK